VVRHPPEFRAMLPSRRRLSGKQPGAGIAVQPSPTSVDSKDKSDSESDSDSDSDTDSDDAKAVLSPTKRRKTASKPPKAKDADYERLTLYLKKLRNRRDHWVTHGLPRDKDAEDLDELKEKIATHEDKCKTRRSEISNLTAVVVTLDAAQETHSKAIANIVKAARTILMNAWAAEDAHKDTHEVAVELFSYDQLRAELEETKKAQESLQNALAEKNIVIDQLKSALETRPSFGGVDAVGEAEQANEHAVAATASEASGSDERLGDELSLEYQAADDMTGIRPVTSLPQASSEILQTESSWQVVESPDVSQVQGQSPSPQTEDHHRFGLEEERGVATVPVGAPSTSVSSRDIIQPDVATQQGSEPMDLECAKPPSLDVKTEDLIGFDFCAGQRDHGLQVFHLQQSKDDQSFELEADQRVAGVSVDTHNSSLQSPDIIQPELSVQQGSQPIDNEYAQIPSFDVNADDLESFEKQAGQRAHRAQLSNCKIGTHEDLATTSAIGERAVGLNSA